MPRSGRRWILSPIAAASLLLAAAGSVLAAPETSVSVFNEDGTPAGATVCEFYMEFGPVEGDESGAWELRDAGGTAVEDGEYSVTGSEADRVPDDGTFSLPNGTYTLVWDDESPIDQSNETLEVVVECEVATPAPTETAVPTPTFNQTLEAETDAPRMSQPDTSALGRSESSDTAAWTGALLAILGLAAIVLVLTPRPRSGRR